MKIRAVLVVIVLGLLTVFIDFSVKGDHVGAAVAAGLLLIPGIVLLIDGIAQTIHNERNRYR